MSRKPKDIKPLLATKHDFVASLDNVIEKSMVLVQAVESALDLGAVTNEGVAKMLREKTDAFKKSVFADE